MEAPNQANASNEFLELPIELQLTCLGLVPDIASLCHALSSCSTLRQRKEGAFKAFCHHNWPKIAHVASNAIEGNETPFAFWEQVVHRAFMIHSATAATIDPMRTFNGHMTELRRVMVIEWLVQVSQARQLDGAAVFLATRFMDVYLALTPPVPVSMLQLVGISSLRTALRVLQNQKNMCSETKVKRAWVDPFMQDASTAAAASLATAVPLPCGCLNSTRSKELRGPRPCLRRPSTWNSD
ncbi:hypothetical protein VaNZ11_014212, partial [Volvox africanus]